MNKYMKRTLTILAILVLGVIICIPVLGEGSAAPKVTSGTTVKTSDLFYAYPYHLKAKNQAYATGMEYFSDYQLIFAHEQATNAIYDISSEDEAMMTVITSLKNGVEYTFWELGSALGLTGDFESNAADRATKQLLAATMQNEGILTALVEENEAMQAAWESIKNADDFMTSGTFALISDSQKEAIQAALDEKADVLGAVDAALSAAEVGAYICFMEQVDTAVINYIRTYTDNSALSSSLYNYLSHKNSNYQTYIIDKYISETTIDLMNQAVQKGLSHVGTSAGALFTVVDLICEATGSGLSWATGLGTNEDLVVSMMLDSYVNDFVSARTEMINRFLTEPVLPSMIEDYKNVYTFYAISVRALAESVKDVNKAHEGLMDYAVGNIDEYVSFDAHLDGCKLAVENTPVEERSVVKGNPELYYIVTADTKISEPSDIIEDNTIYFANGTIYYGIELNRSNLDFPQYGEAVDRKINGNIFVKKSTVITIPENMNMHITGDVTVDMRTSQLAQQQLVIEGKLKISGDFTELKYGYYEDGKMDIYMDNESAVFEMEGNVDLHYGEWRVTAGRVIFSGQNISAPRMEWMQSGTIELHTDGTGTIDINIVNFEPGTQPIDLYITRYTGSADYVLEGDISGYQLYVDDIEKYDMSKYHSTSWPAGLKVEDTLHVDSIFTTGGIKVEGNLIVDNDCIMTGDNYLHVSGDVAVNGDCYLEGGTGFEFGGATQSNLKVTGNVVIDGDCTLDSGMMITDRGSLKVNGTFQDLDGGSDLYIYLEGEAPLVEFAGDVELYDETDSVRWLLSTGKIIFSGNKVSAPTLGRIADTAIEIRTEGTEAVDIGLFDIAAGTEPVSLDVSYKDEVYYVSGTASGHAMSTDVMDVLYVNENGGYTSSHDFLTIDVKDELLLGSLTATDTKFRVAGNMTVENDCAFISDWGGKSDLTVEGTLKLGGDLSIEGEYDFDGTLVFVGTGDQNVDVNYARFNTIILENTSEAGVTFLHWFEMLGLFNHNQNNFTLSNGCMTIDYDGDGLNDEVDPYPADASLPADITINYECVEIEIPGGNSVYTGEPIYPIVTVTLAGKVLVENVDYMVQHLDNVNAGTGKVIVTAIAPYLGSAEVRYHIGKAEPTISVTDNWNYTTDTESFVLDASLIRGDGALTYESTNEDVLTVDEHGVVTVKKAGSAIVWIRVEETTNYQSTVVGTSITIDRGAIIEGDYDDNRVVNSNDAIYLLYHTLMPEQYPIYQNADYDGNGIVNSNDAIKLLYDLTLPDEDDSNQEGDNNNNEGLKEEIKEDTGNFGPLF